MKWKKAVALSLAAMMALGAAGCGDKEAGGGTKLPGGARRIRQ